MKVYIGIDFGACNIKAVQVNSNGKAKKLKLNKDQSGKEFTPNVLLYEKIKDNIEIHVGQGAKRSIDYENKIWQIKPKISQKTWSKYIQSLERDVTVAEAVKNIFAWIWKNITEKFSNVDEFDVTITVPVSFSEVQKNFIQQTAVEIGIPVTGIVNEPFAAMFSLENFFDEKKDQTVLIFDFGGSTLDLSLFRIEHSDDAVKVTELAAAGLKFGGIDIDEEIFKNIISVKFADDIKEILDSGASKNVVMQEIETIKENIFSEDGEDSAQGFPVDKRGGIHTLTVERAEIISMIDKMKINEKIVALLDELLEDAKIDKSEVTSVKPFGGTSMIDNFLHMLTDYFGDDIFDCADFEKEDIYMSVATGAAMYRYMTDKESGNVIIRNTVPYNIGLCSNQRFVRYVNRNQLSGWVSLKQPISISELDKNNWRVDVYQSFSNECDLPQDSEDVIYIGNVQLDKNLYSVKDAILFTMSPDGKGNITMKFYEFPLGGDEKLIEEKIVKVG